MKNMKLFKKTIFLIIFLKLNILSAIFLQPDIEHKIAYIISFLIYTLFISGISLLSILYTNYKVNKIKLEFLEEKELID